MVLHGEKMTMRICNLGHKSRNCT